jgi:GNAT superfamily N-acetyltransferase
MPNSEHIAAEAFRSFYGSRAVEAGGGIALRAPEAPGSAMLNRIIGLGVAEPATEAGLDEALAAIGRTAVYVSVSPTARPPQLASWLEARGFEPGWGWMLFERGPEEPPAVETSLEIVEAGPELVLDFGRIVAAGYGLPAESAAWAGSATGTPGWTCWLALADDEPAAAAALWAGEGGAYFGFAATLPEHRGRGAQGGLLAARIRRARELGCEKLVTETGELREGSPSNSYRNILRFGFEERYVVPNWLRPPK